MIKTLLASVGIGAAKVDTILSSERLYPGSPFTAQIHITGGDVEQRIDHIDLALVTKVKVEINDHTSYQNHCLNQWKIPVNKTVGVGETFTIPFSGQLHPETPVTYITEGRIQSHVWLQTGLDIDFAVDPKDVDHLTIMPTPIIEHCLRAMREFGYRLVKTDVEKGNLRGRHFRSRAGCYQEFEFQPISRTLFGVKEVELSFVEDGQVTHVMVERDRAFRGDDYRSISLGHGSGYGHVKGELRRVLG